MIDQAREQIFDLSGELKNVANDLDNIAFKLHGKQAQESGVMNAREIEQLYNAAPVDVKPWIGCIIFRNDIPQTKDPK